MTQVVNLLLDALVTHLGTQMNDGLETTALNYVDNIKKGLLQENKLVKNVALGISGGDHDDPEYKDGIVTLEELKNIGFYVDPREVGGSQVWWRRGTIRVECFFIREGLTENQAFDAGYEVLGHLEDNIENLDVTGIVDTYGERAIKVFCYANTYFESGGPPKSFIFRGKVFWQCLTERE